MFESLLKLLTPLPKRLKLAALESVFEDSASGRMITDINGAIVAANQKMQDICAGKPASLTAIRALFKDTQRFDHLLRRGEAGEGDTADLITVADKWLGVAVMPVTDIAGLLHWRFDDITARKSLDTLIRAERAQLVDFTDQAPLGFYTVDQEGRFTYVNATLARWLDCDPKDLLGQFLHDVFRDKPAAMPAYEAPAEGRLRGKKDASLNVTIIQNHEAENHANFTARGIMVDTTDERRMARALRESEDRFKIFFDEAPLGIALVDRAGVLLDINPRLEDILDTARGGDSVNTRLETFIEDEESRSKIAQFLHNLQSATLPQSAIDIRLKGRNGTVPMQMYARILPGAEQAVLHFIDLSEQKRLEAQFVQSQKMQAVGQLAGGIAHDFNNLLTAMIGFCDLLLLRHKPSDPSFADVMQIKQNANRAANLVRQLLAFSRQQTLQPKTLDPSEVLTELSHLLRRLIGPNIDLKLHYDPDLGYVKADQGQLEQVMINLVVNARDAMDGAGTLHISMKPHLTTKPTPIGADTQPAGEWVAISVSDTGSGISPENMARIFDPFFTTKAVGAGTGLGLATVYGIVHQTGGYIQVQSDLGKGTTFTLFLPRINERKNESIAAETTDTLSDLTGAAHVVLVEDEDAVRAFSKRALANKGYHVTDFPDGRAAKQWFDEAEKAPDLLITDVIMPELDGPTLARHVRGIFPHLKIIFVSGYTEDKFKKELGADIHFLPKPFSLQQLAVKVKEVLA